MTARTKTLCGLTGVALLVAFFGWQYGAPIASPAAPSSIAPSAATGPDAGRSDVTSRTSGGRRPVRPVLRVRITNGTRAVAGADVTIRTPDGVQAQTTSASGVATFKLATPARASVHARAPAHVATDGEVEVTDRHARLSLQLTPASQLDGRIIGYTGAPADLSIVAHADAAEGKMAATAVAPDGTFHIDDVEPGAYSLALNPDAYRIDPVRVSLLPGQRQYVELTLPQLGTLRVHTEALENPAKEGGRLVLRSPAGDEMSRDIPLTPHHVEHLVGIPAGRYSVQLETFTVARRPLQFVTIVAGETSDLTFTWPTGELRGYIRFGRDAAPGASIGAFRILRDETGAPYRDHRPEQVTQAGADGSYRLPGLDAGHYIVGSLGDGALGSVEADVAEGAVQTADVTLERITTLATRVSYQGRPVEGAHVFATSEPYALNARSGLTGVDGLAELGSLTRGQYRLHAMWSDEDSGAMREASQTITITGSETRPVDLQIH